MVDIAAVMGNKQSLGDQFSAAGRVGDYWKLGLPVMAWWAVVSLVVALLVVPWVWRP